MTAFMLHVWSKLLPPPQAAAQPNVLRTLTARVQILEGKVASMSAEIQALQALVTKTITDVNTKLASLQTGSLSAEDQATIASITTALTDLDTQVSAPAAPATPPA